MMNVGFWGNYYFGLLPEVLQSCRLMQARSGERAMWMSNCMMNEQDVDGNHSKFKESNDQLKEVMGELLWNAVQL